MSLAKTLKQLQKELHMISRDPPPGISADATEDDLFTWDAMILGPDDTPFEGGTYRLKMHFPPEYPMKPPTVWFYSRMFHPNVYPDGRICLDILEKEHMWLPEYDAAAVLCAVQAMLGDPNPESPANGEANLLFTTDLKNYEQRVRQIAGMSENDDDGKNLNAQDRTENIEERLRELDLSEFDGNPEAVREFLKSV